MERPHWWRFTGTVLRKEGLFLSWFLNITPSVRGWNKGCCEHVRRFQRHEMLLPTVPPPCLKFLQVQERRRYPSQQSLRPQTHKHRRKDTNPSFSAKNQWMYLSHSEDKVNKIPELISTSCCCREKCSKDTFLLGTELLQREKWAPGIQWDAPGRGVSEKLNRQWEVPRIQTQSPPLLSLGNLWELFA